jgi:hypothetical protein
MAADGTHALKITVTAEFRFQERAVAVVIGGAGHCIGCIKA